MSVTSNSTARPASATGIPEGMGFSVVLALILVAIAAGPSSSWAMCRTRSLRRHMWDPKPTEARV